MKLRPVGAELLHDDGQTDRHDEGNGLFFANLRKPKRLKNCLQ